MKRKDIGIVAGILLVALALLGAQAYRQRTLARTVKVTVAGDVYGTYPLDKDQEVKIGDTNTLQIKNGNANIIWADCRNQICVHHRAISKNGQTITCLPNKVVVEILGGEENNVDAIAR